MWRTEVRMWRSPRLSMAFRVGYCSPSSQAMLKFLSHVKTCSILSWSRFCSRRYTRKTSIRSMRQAVSRHHRITCFVRAISLVIPAAATPLCILMVTCCSTRQPRCSPRQLWCSVLQPAALGLTRRKNVNFCALFLDCLVLIKGQGSGLSRNVSRKEYFVCWVCPWTRDSLGPTKLLIGNYCLKLSRHPSICHIPVIWQVYDR